MPASFILNIKSLRGRGRGGDCNQEKVSAKCIKFFMDSYLCLVDDIGSYLQGLRNTMKSRGKFCEIASHSSQG